jgi:hypothetical protein
VATALIAPGAQASTARVFDLTFDSSASRQLGSADLTVRTVTANGGSIAQATGYDGSGAGDFPDYAATDPPMAVTTAVDETGTDDLAPRKSAFTFGADFALDAVNEGSSVDNGNNLIQRGLYTSSMQFKIQLDSDRPSCRVKGSAGAVSVPAPMTAEQGTWYSASCHRAGQDVVLTVRRLSDGRVWTAKRSGPIGTLTTSASVPLSVGGKASSATSIMTSASDQFNGLIDNAFLDIG